MVAVFSALPRLVLSEIGQLTVWEDISSGGASVNFPPGFPVCAGGGLVLHLPAAFAPGLAVCDP